MVLRRSYKISKEITLPFPKIIKVGQIIRKDKEG